MPHIAIKLIGSPSEDQKKRVAEKIANILEEDLGKPKKYISISFEEKSFADWEEVFNLEIKDNKNLVLEPGYSNPKTFQ